MASTGSITVSLVVQGYPPNSGNSTFQESMILDVPNGDDTESYFRRIVAEMRNTLPGPTAIAGVADMEFNPVTHCWRGTLEKQQSAVDVVTPSRSTELGWPGPGA